MTGGTRRWTGTTPAPGRCCTESRKSAPRCPTSCRAMTCCTSTTRGNVLVDERGRITGVVDWNLGVARGDRHYALVSLRSDLAWNALPRNGIDDVHRATMERLDRVLEQRIDPTTLRGYWASRSIDVGDGKSPAARSTSASLEYKSRTGRSARVTPRNVTFSPPNITHLSVACSAASAWAIVVPG